MVHYLASISVCAPLLEAACDTRRKRRTPEAWWILKGTYNLWWKKRLSQSAYSSEFSFTPLWTLAGPISLSLTMAAQNITPPPPCCHRCLIGSEAESIAHSVAHPSGPSKVARASSVHKTWEKFTFMWSLAHFSLLAWCLALSRGREGAFMTDPIWLRTLQRLYGSLEWPQLHQRFPC